MGRGPDENLLAGRNQEARVGCQGCHPRLLETLPANHRDRGQGEIKYCLTCHSARGLGPPFVWVMHFKHYAHSGFKGDCLSCHQLDNRGSLAVIGADNPKMIGVSKVTLQKMGSYFRSWAASSFLDFRHARAGFTCEHCHETYFPKGGSSEACIRCHGSYKNLAVLTKAVRPNPHASHQTDLACTNCHKAHQKSKLYCDLCHSFELQVP